MPALIFTQKRWLGHRWKSCRCVCGRHKIPCTHCFPDITKENFVYPCAEFVRLCECIESRETCQNRIESISCHSFVSLCNHQSFVSILLLLLVVLLLLSLCQCSWAGKASVSFHGIIDLPMHEAEQPKIGSAIILAQQRSTAIISALVFVSVEYIYILYMPVAATEMIDSARRMTTVIFIFFSICTLNRFLLRDWI